MAHALLRAASRLFSTPNGRSRTQDRGFEFAANQIFKWGIPVVELTTMVPGATNVIRELPRTNPRLIVGGCGRGILNQPGGRYRHWRILRPPQRRRHAGRVKDQFFPCAQVGGLDYIKALKGPFPHVRSIASGGVNQQTAADFIRKGASALGIRGELIPPDAIHCRDENWIHELTGRFLDLVQHTRVEFGLQ